MAQRTQVTQSMRYQVLRRDGFACQYCGGQAPDVSLEVDHVVPVALGGSNDPTNLTTACKACNSGKGKGVPDEQVVAAVSEQNQRWADALAEAAEIVRQASAEYEEEVSEFEDAWARWHNATTKRTVPLPGGYQQSVITWLRRGLDIDDLLELIPVAMGKSGIPMDQVFRYFAGCAWRRVAVIEEVAERIVAESEAAR